MKNLNNDIRNNKDNYEEVDNSEISIDILNNKPEIEDVEIEPENNEKNLDENKKEDTEDEFQLDVENLQFEKYNMPLGGINGKANKKRGNTTRKFDYKNLAKRNKIKGDLGEKAVVMMEENKLEDTSKIAIYYNNYKDNYKMFYINSIKLLQILLQTNKKDCST